MILILRYILTGSDVLKKRHVAGLILLLGFNRLGKVFEQVADGFTGCHLRRTLVKGLHEGVDPQGSGEHLCRAGVRIRLPAGVIVQGFDFSGRELVESFQDIRRGRFATAGYYRPERFFFAGNVVQEYFGLGIFQGSFGSGFLSRRPPPGERDHFQWGHDE
jgi:hypothetical protein